jgi:hypothetical protein
MMNALIALGLGIIVFALVVGVGVVVLVNFGATVAECPTGYRFNTTSENCMVPTNTSNTTSATGTGYTTNTTLMGYLSTNLITWVPAIIALGVGLLFIGALMNRGQKNF